MNKKKVMFDDLIDEYCKKEGVDKVIGNVYKKLYSFNVECFEHYYRGKLVNDEYKGGRKEVIKLSMSFRKFLEKEIGEIKKVIGTYKGFYDDGDLRVSVYFENGKKLCITHFGRGFNVQIR